MRCCDLLAIENLEVCIKNICIFSFTTPEMYVSNSQLIVADYVIERKSEVKYLGIIIDSKLISEDQVENVCSNRHISLRQISQICCYLTREAAATLVHAFIVSKLDCFNALLTGIPDWLIRKLQLIQSNAARLVTRKHDGITCTLKELHCTRSRCVIQ